MSLYLLLNIITFGTVFLSFDKKVAFYKHFKNLFVGIIINMVLFIPWDIWFTNKGVWGFTPQYLSGIYVSNLPIEEWLFFLTVPFSCVFIYYVLKAYFKNPINSNFSSKFWTILSFLVLTIGLINFDLLYTFTTFFTASLVIYFLNRYQPNFMNDFLFSYVVCLIPFIVINGILTGAITEKPIVWYNNIENFGIRFITIPIEDFIYNILLLLIPTFITVNLSNKIKQ